MLDTAVKVVKNINDISIFLLSSNDVVLHPLVQKIVKAYNLLFPYKNDIYASMKKRLQYIWPVAICLVTGFSASLFQKTALADWYPTLEKSVLTPPALVFPVVWTILYVLMVIALGRIQGKNLQRAIGLWWIQLAFNFSWSIVFFYLTSHWWGLLVILLLDGLV